MVKNLIYKHCQNPLTEKYEWLLYLQKETETRKLIGDPWSSFIELLKHRNKL